MIYEHNNIRYTDRHAGEKYKYRLLRAYTILTPLMLALPITTRYLTLVDGRLTIALNYAWDGPSGISIDTRTFRRGSLVHDAVYQLCREGWLDYKIHREIGDRLLQQICTEDGMWPIRASWVYAGVHLFGERHAKPPEFPFPAK